MSGGRRDTRPPADVTLALRAVAAGGAAGDGAHSRLFELVYDGLQRLAARHLSRERSDHTLQATALVHEAWIKLVDQSVVPDRGREHFLSVASQAMRRILVDHARGRHRSKRGGDRARVPLDALDEPSAVGAEVELDLVELDAALQRLGERAPRQARLVELRFFGGLTMPEVAGALDVSLTTAEREWRVARAWLLSRVDR
ncbi:MAG: ECF-type sigma factor [Planctomycetota bacterium]